MSCRLCKGDESHGSALQCLDWMQKELAKYRTKDQWITSVENAVKDSGVRWFPGNPAASVKAIAAQLKVARNKSKLVGPIKKVVALWNEGAMGDCDVAVQEALYELSVAAGL